MKEIFVFILMFFLICPIDIFSQEKPHKTAKRAKIETISKKRAKSKTAPKKKKAQEKRQKARIENNKPENMNHLRKK
jgi:hypothetical protein